MINDHKTPMRLRVHSRDKVIDYGTQFGEWKIQLTIQINSISSKDSAETCTMYTKSDNVEIMLGSKTDDIITECFDSLSQKNQKNWKNQWEEVISFLIVLIYCIIIFRKTSLKTGGSSIKSPKWLKNKKATINPKNYDDDNCL